MRVLVAMSGGVDSSVAAAQMVEQGHDVVGVTLKLWEGPNGEAPTAGCCTVSDSEDARRVAAQLDIPYYVLNYTSAFGQGVIDKFVDDYLRGWTPNPCVECNRSVKFDKLLDQAAEFDCDMLVTGHYARVQETGGRFQLLRGLDPSKDQSYVLYMLGQQQLSKVQFPVGEQTKAETRAIAEELGLRTAFKADSQDICFVGTGDYRDFVDGQTDAATAPGDMVDTEGNKVAEHAGVVGFTIGQRRGLGVTFGEPRYVVKVEPSTSTVVLGKKEDLETADCVLREVTWTDQPHQGLASFQYRAHGDPASCSVTEQPDGSWLVTFEEPQLAIAPGQAGVLYDGDEVLGGGTITRGT